MLVRTGNDTQDSLLKIQHRQSNSDLKEQITEVFLRSVVLDRIRKNLEIDYLE